MPTDIDLDARDCAAIGLALSHYTADFKEGLIPADQIGKNADAIIAVMDRLKMEFLFHTVGCLPPELYEDFKEKMENGYFTEKQPSSDPHSVDPS